METPQRSQNVGGDSPQLRLKEKHRLNHYQVKPTRGSNVIPLLENKTGEPAPFYLIYLEFPGQNVPVSVIKGNNLYQVLKFVHLLKYMVKSLELHTCCLLRFSVG